MRILLFLITNIAVLAVASVAFSLLGFEGILAANGVDLDPGALLVFCALFGMGGSLVSLAMSKMIAKMSTRARIIETPDNQSEQWLVSTVEKLAGKAGIGMPQVAVFPSDQPNAFATGANRNNALVAVSTGLLQAMPPEEVEAVLAHEVGHVANGDMITLTLLQGVVNTFVLFFSRVIGFLVDRVVLRNERGLGIGYFVSSIVAQIVLGILASTIVMWFSRRREFRADESGAELSSNTNMINALKRLKRSQEMPDTMPDTLTAFGISSGSRSGIKALFASHPPLDDRIAALEQTN